MQAITKPDLMMTVDQRRLVRDSIASLRDYGESFPLLFYGKLFELDPNSRKLFHNDLALQGKKVMDMLTSIVESLDDFQPMRARLAELGRKHTEYGVKNEQYEILTTALLWAIAQALGPDFDAETREAWQLTLNAISTAMRAGATPRLQ